MVRFVNVPDTAVGERREWSVDDIKRLVDKWADPSVAVLLRQFVERVSGRGVRLEPECNGLPTADWWGVSSEGAQASDAWRGADQPASVCRSSRYYRCKGDGFSPTVVAVGVPVRAGAAPGQRGARLCGGHVLLRPSARRPFLVGVPDQSAWPPEAASSAQAPSPCEANRNASDTWTRRSVTEPLNHRWLLRSRRRAVTAESLHRPTRSDDVTSPRVLNTTSVSLTLGDVARRRTYDPRRAQTVPCSSLKSPAHAASAGHAELRTLVYVRSAAANQITLA